jgi:hypothetical protein
VVLPVSVEREAELLEEVLESRSGCGLRLPPLCSRRLGLPPDLGLVQDRRWNDLCRREVTNRHLVPPEISHHRPRKALEVYSRGRRGCRQGICCIDP